MDVMVGKEQREKEATISESFAVILLLMIMKDDAATFVPR
jgi:hypothetical protein